MECFENEVINLEETGGIDLSYGNADGMIAMLEKTLTEKGLAIFWLMARQKRPIVWVRGMSIC